MASGILPFPADIDRVAFGYWLSGFVDGEGCFFLGTYPGKRVFALARFSIRLRLDDAPILRLIQSYLSCGILRPYRGIQRDPCRRNSRPQMNFVVHSVDDLLTNIAPHFHQFPLRAKKALDFPVWLRGVQLMQGIKGRPIRGFGNGGGTYPRWTAAERFAFTDLVLELKNVRAFVDPIE